MSEKTQTARALFDAKFNCAQSVFAAFAEDLDVDMEIALRTAGGFGAGLMCGEICGAASGAVMALGAKYGHYIEGDMGAKRNCRTKTEEFLREFKRRTGGKLTCRDQLGYDVNTPDGQARVSSSGDLANVCGWLVETAAEILEIMLSDV